MTVTPSTTGTASYQLSCTGAGGSNAQSASLTVAAVPQDVAVPDLFATAAIRSPIACGPWSTAAYSLQCAAGVIQVPSGYIALPASTSTSLHAAETVSAAGSQITAWTTGGACSGNMDAAGNLALATSFQNYTFSFASSTVSVLTLNSTAANPLWAAAPVQIQYVSNADPTSLAFVGFVPMLPSPVTGVAGTLEIIGAGTVVPGTTAGTFNVTLDLCNGQLGTTSANPPPAAPTNVTANATSATSVTVTWTASTDTGGPGIGGYHVFRADQPAAIATVAANQTSYGDTTVAPSTSYIYTVQAFDLTTPTALVSAQSSPAMTTTPPLAAACTKASGSGTNGLSWGAGQFISWRQVSGALITVNWGVSYDDPNLASTSYTGSLRAVVWAVAFDYQGGAIPSGYVLGTAVPNFVGAGAKTSNQIYNFFTFRNLSETVAYTGPPSGNYCVVVTLEQIVNNQFVIEDWVNTGESTF